MNKSHRVEFLCPVRLLEDFDEACNRQYKDRSETIRELMRRYVKNEKEAQE